MRGTVETQETSPETSRAPLRRAVRTVRRRWRPWLRAAHRDVGYLVVGLTFIYALSGIAINHIKDWNPNFDAVERSYTVELPLPDDERAAADRVLADIGADGPPTDAYFATDTQLEIELGDDHYVHVDLESGAVQEEYQQPRFFLRVANWLHYNRGKAAWTYVADGYAGLLLLLALSGVFMLKGRKGFVGRGAILIAIGVAVPILYVHLSGGPGGG